MANTKPAKCSDIVHLRILETLQTRQLHHLNVSDSIIRQKQTGRRVQKYSDILSLQIETKVITNDFLSLCICGHTDSKEYITHKRDKMDFL